MKPRNLLTISVVFLLFLINGCGPTRQGVEEKPLQPLSLDIVYPRAGAQDTTLSEAGDTIIYVPRVDSMFAFGSVQPADGDLFVEGQPVQVWENGAFLAFFPLDSVGKAYQFAVYYPDGRQLIKPLTLDYRTWQGDATIDSIEVERNADLPAAIEVTSDHAVLRNEPWLAYWMFPPAGCSAMADSFNYPYYRIGLAEGLHGWIEERLVDVDTTQINQKPVVIHWAKVTADSAWTRIEIPLKRKIFYNIGEGLQPNSLYVDLYNAHARVDEIHYDRYDTVLREINWEQVSDSIVRLYLDLNQSQSWGYRTFYEGSTLVILLRREPVIQRKVLKDRIIAIDAGHGGNYFGAIGPTRLAEKDANLDIAREVRRRLERAGARVIMTRDDDATRGIYERVDLAFEAGAEVLISIHNNALADGRNPFENHGTAVYYYRSQSRDLARIMHEALLEATGLQDHGLYYKNLALARPTEMPAVLLECAFMMHPAEEILLRNERFIERTAQGITEGIKRFFEAAKQNEVQYKNRGYLHREPVISRPIWHPLTSEMQHE